jgi:hypothetical protein
VHFNLEGTHVHIITPPRGRKPLRSVPRLLDGSDMAEAAIAAALAAAARAEADADAAIAARKLAFQARGRAASTAHLGAPRLDGGGGGGGGGEDARA